MIFWSKEFTAYKIGSVEKSVSCERCGANYVYSLTREVTGLGSSWYSIDNSAAASRAATRAERALKDALESGVDPRPCPRCGHFQRNMIARARQQVLAWMNFRVMLLILMCYVPLIFVLTILNGILREIGPVVPWVTFFESLLWIAIFLAASIPGVPIVRWAISQFYDPNTESSAGRLKKGFYAGTVRADLTESPQTLERMRDSLRAWARRLLASPHPADDLDEKNRHLDRFLLHYVQGGSFPFELKDLLRLSALLLYGKAIQLGAIASPSKLADYYLECVDVLERIYFDVFRESPRVDEPMWQPGPLPANRDANLTAIQTKNPSATELQETQRDSSPR